MRNNSDRRGMFALATLVMSAGLSAAAVAYACIPVGTIETDRSEAFAGQTVQVLGRDFVATAEVEIHLDGYDRWPLWSGTADALGEFRAAFEVPNVDAGIHYVVAHYHPHTSGEPAREVLKVLARGAGPDQPTESEEESPPEGKTVAAGAPGSKRAGKDDGARQPRRSAKKKAGEDQKKRERAKSERNEPPTDDEARSAFYPPRASAEPSGGDSSPIAELIVTSLGVIALFASGGAFLIRRKRRRVAAA